jgi:hypothetical protein
VRFGVSCSDIKPASTIKVPSTLTVGIEGNENTVVLDGHDGAKVPAPASEKLAPQLLEARCRSRAARRR